MMSMVLPAVFGENLMDVFDDFDRSFYVGDGVTETDVKASYASGVLHIRVPKKEAQKLPEKNTILIEG